MMDNQTVAENLLTRLAPCRGDATDDRIWRFGQRMATIYQQQMERFDEDEEARQWRRLYSADNMPPPSETRSKADVAAMMAFYSPTNFCKFQKVVTQQLLEWYFRQAQVNPYPFGTPNITLIDVGAGAGIAALATVDLLATWAEVFAELGYRQLGLSVRIVAVEPDNKKQSPRREMFAAMSSMLDRHLIQVERLTEILLPYPGSDCVQRVFDAVAGGSFAICCMSNFLSSLYADERRLSAPPALQTGSQAIGVSDYVEVIQCDQAPISTEKALECAKGTGHLLAKLPFRNRLLLAAELQQRGQIVRSFARSLHPSAELLARSNHIRFYAPRGSYWHSLRSSEQAGEPDWATGFWSLAHWTVGSNGFVR